LLKMIRFLCSPSRSRANSTFVNTVFQTDFLLLTYRVPLWKILSLFCFVWH
jgi:hypothetical protein